MRGDFIFAPTLARYCLPLLAGAGVDGAGASGRGDEVPEPVVEGGVTLCGALLVVTGGAPLLAVLLLL